MSTEDDALERLLDEGSRLGLPATAYGPGPDQVLEVHGPGAGRTLVLVHGGYFRPGVDRTHARPMARALGQLGWRVVLAEYRRVPGAPFVTTDDLAALDAHLHDTGHEVAAWVGHSAGGALVLWRASVPDLPPVPVVALAPLGDLDAAIAERLGTDAVGDWLGQAPGAVEVLDPRRLLGANPGAAERIRVLHGDRDESVPLSQSADLPVARTVVEGAHHFDLVEPTSPHWPKVVAAISGR